MLIACIVPVLAVLQRLSRVSRVFQVIAQPRARSHPRSRRVLLLRRARPLRRLATPSLDTQ